MLLLLLLLLFYNDKYDTSHRLTRFFFWKTILVSVPTCGCLQLYGDCYNNDSTLIRRSSILNFHLTRFDGRSTIIPRTFQSVETPLRYIPGHPAARHVAATDHGVSRRHDDTTSQCSTCDASSKWKCRTGVGAVKASRFASPCDPPLHAPSARACCIARSFVTSTTYMPAY